MPLVARDDANAERMFGQWIDDDGTVFCQTVERSADDAKFPCIPAGRYPVTLRHSEKHGHAVWGVNDVPGRRNIEVHNANIALQLEGCVGVGSKRDKHMEIPGYPPEDGVEHSRDTLDRLMAHTGCAEYKTLTTPAMVEAWNAAHPDAGFTLVVEDPSP